MKKYALLAFLFSGRFIAGNTPGFSSDDVCDPDAMKDESSFITASFVQKALKEKGVEGLHGYLLSLVDSVSRDLEDRSVTIGPIINEIEQANPAVYRAYVAEGKKIALVMFGEKEKALAKDILSQLKPGDTFEAFKAIAEESAVAVPAGMSSEDRELITKLASRDSNHPVAVASSGGRAIINKPVIQAGSVTQNHYIMEQGSLILAGLVLVAGFLLFLLYVVYGMRKVQETITVDQHVSLDELSDKETFLLNGIVIPGGVESLTKNHYQKELSDLFELKAYRVVVIHGMGGTGKSILAKTEALKKEIPYAVCFQLEVDSKADSDDALLSGLMALYEECVADANANAQAVRDQLNKEPDQQKKASKLLLLLRSTLQKDDHRPSLLVLDNIQKETPLLRQAIDTLTETRFLITTRDSQLLVSRSEGKKSTVGSLSLNKGWREEECLSFLKKDLGSLEERQSLCAYLPFPLGLKVASQTIKQLRKTRGKVYTCAKYVSDLRSGLNDRDEAQAMRLSSEEDLSRRQTEVLKQSIALIDTQGGKALLRFISHLAPSPIPYSSIRKYVDRLFAHLKESDRMVLLEDGLHQLASLSLVDRVMEEGVIAGLSIHELVQDVARRAYASEKATKGSHFIQTMIETFTSWINHNPSKNTSIQTMINTVISWVAIDNRLLSDPSQRKRIRSALTHSEAFAEHIADEDANIGRLYHDLGKAYGALGDAAKQKELLERALAIFEAHYDAKHPTIAITLGNLGNAYGALGDAAKQKELLERALAMFESHYEPNHPTIAIALTNLGNAYGALGDAQKKKELLERALAIEEAYYDAKHPEIAKTLTNLGNAYGDLGDAGKQKELLERALAIKEAYYDAKHPEIAITLTNLGNAYGALGDAGKQKELLERALAIDEVYYDAMHPEIAITLTSLGTAYGGLGDARKKKELLERALAINEAYYDAKHPEIAITLGNLGNAYGALGDAAKQKELLERALAIKEAYYDAMHPEIAMTLFNLCWARLALEEDLDSIVSDARKVKTIFDSYYGSKHEYTKKAVSLMDKVGKARKKGQDRGVNFFRHGKKETREKKTSHEGGGGAKP